MKLKVYLGVNKRTCLTTTLQSLSHAFHFLFKDVAAYKAKLNPGKSDAGKKGGPGRPAAKKAVPVDDDDDDDDDDDEEDDDDDDDDE